MKLKALPFILVNGFFFGSSLVGSRFAIGQFTPLAFVSWRILSAALCFLAIYLVMRQRYPWPRQAALWRHGLVLGVLATAVPMFAFVSALQYLSSGITGVINSTGPALTVVLAHFLLKNERLTLQKIVGVILALTGALLLALRGESGLVGVVSANPIGYWLIGIGLIAISISTIYAKRYASDFSAFDLTSSQIFFATLIVLPILLFREGVDFTQVDLLGYGALLYGAVIGTVAAFLLYFYNIQRFGATAAAMTPYIVPIVATIGGALLLDETVTPGMLFGMGLILLGVGLINSGK